jgi:hypothetical protein
MRELARGARGGRAAALGQWPARLLMAFGLGLTVAAGGAVWAGAYVILMLLLR